MKKRAGKGEGPAKETLAWVWKTRTLSSPRNVLLPDFSGLLVGVRGVLQAAAARLSSLFQQSSMWAVLAVIYPYCLSLAAMAMALSALFTQVLLLPLQLFPQGPQPSPQVALLVLHLLPRLVHPS